MANITEEHLHHMARRHHATMKKLEGVQAAVAARLAGFVSTLEVGAGAWLGGAIEGKTGGGTVLKVPINLGVGLIFLGASHVMGDRLGRWSDDLGHLGNGLIGSYIAATGYAWGKRWKETGKLFGHHSWSTPYAAGEGWGPPAAGGALSEAEMAAIVQRMQAAAAAPAMP